MSAEMLVKISTESFLLTLDFSEFHTNAHEKAGLRGIVGQAVLHVIHVEVAVACVN